MIEEKGLVTLDNNKSYVILDQVTLNDAIYCFITDLIDDETFIIVKKEIEDNKCFFKLLNDNNLEDYLKDTFAKRLGIEV